MPSTNLHPLYQIVTCLPTYQLASTKYLLCSYLDRTCMQHVSTSNLPVQSCTYLPVHTYQYIPTSTYLPVHTYQYIHTSTYLPVYTYQYIPTSTYLPPLHGIEAHLLELICVATHSDNLPQPLLALELSGERANGRTSGRTGERTGERTNGRTGERTGERANGRTGERAGGRTGERAGGQVRRCAGAQVRS
jgi:hypothetical protein